MKTSKDTSKNVLKSSRNDPRCVENVLQTSKKFQNSQKIVKKNSKND